MKKSALQCFLYLSLKRRRHVALQGITFFRELLKKEKKKIERKKISLSSKPRRVRKKKLKGSPLQAQIDLVAERMSGMAKSVYEEFIDYRKSNTLLHRDNDRIYARMETLAQRQELQVQREEANTQYLVSLMAYYHNPSFSFMPPVKSFKYKERKPTHSTWRVSLMAYYHNPSSSSVMPLVPPPFELPTWPPPSPLEPSDDDRDHLHSEGSFQYFYIADSVWF